MSVVVILASKSPSRRALLKTAGIVPTIAVSHVDEHAALQQAARSLGKKAEQLSPEQTVSILSQSKAQAVYESYRKVIETARAATGERVTGYPLQAPEVLATSHEAAKPSTLLGNEKNLESAETADKTSNTTSASNGEQSAETGESSDVTRDFSGVHMPIAVEPIASVQPKHSLGRSDKGPLIVACDSMFLFEGQLQGKPHNAQVARERLQAMSGKSGELYTGHTVIDLASGQSASKVDHATVYFDNFTAEDIEAYIATGEPLQVAGTFTLEGFGSAFISRIEGNPSCVQGLSMPTLRTLFSELGVPMHEVWNAGEVRKKLAIAGVSELYNAESTQESATYTNGTESDSEKSDEKQASATNPGLQTTTPKENIHQPGDGWVECNCGRKHWGLNGASGVLLARRNEQGDVTHIVMQHRALWSAEGGTWGIPGGASADGESPIEGALRESREEANILPEDIEVVGTYREDHGNWAYTTVFAFEKPGHTVDPHANDDESVSIQWVPIEQVPTLKLLTAMRTDWPRFEQRLRKLARLHRK